LSQLEVEMSGRSHKFRIEVTVNGDGFDKPSGGKITKTREIPTATLTYPNPHGKFLYYFTPLDEIKIYVGLDRVPETPTFTGYFMSGDGEESHTLSLVGRQSKCQKEYTYITDTDNSDGEEVARVIQAQLHACGFMLNDSKPLKGTYPPFFIPNGYRKPEGITRYDLIKYARDLAYAIDVDTGDILLYHLYEHTNKYGVDDQGQFIFDRQKPMVDGEEDMEMSYGVNLLKTQPTIKMTGVINRQTVFSKDGDMATFNLAHEQAMNGIIEGRPDSLNEGNFEDAWNRARMLCMKNRAPSINTSITNVDLVDAVPYLSYVKIVDSPNLLSGFHRIMETMIDFTSGFKVICGLQKQPPILNKEIVSLLLASSATQAVPPI